MRIFAEILTRIFTKPRFLLALKLYIHIIIYIKNIFNLNTLREQRGKHSTVLVFPSFHAQPLMRKIDQDEVSHASGSFSCKSSPPLHISHYIQRQCVRFVGIART